MKLLLLTAAAMVLQDPTSPQSVFDQPVGELTNEKASDDPLDRMSLNQMMRMTTLHVARMRELKCAGVANWPGSKDWPVFAVTDAQRSDFIDRVATAFAHDLEMDRPIAKALIGKFSEEPPYREKEGDLPEWRAEMEKDCSALMAEVRTGSYQLYPLAQPSVVNDTLATCYARYTLAAERSDAAKQQEEAKGLRGTAAKAEALALAGKEGEALDKAREALAKRVDEERGEPMTADGDDMMRLVMCLPAMDAAKKEQGGK